MTENIERILVLSTAHMSEEESKLFEETQHMLIPAFKRDEGFIFHTSTVGICYDKLSPGWAQIYQIATERNCAWIMFDRDADVIDGIPTFDW
ncbi:hypothetical protein HGG70_05195 [Rhodobacteraceae bacterium R_SAG4]|nr:hypothetical protein [Rhodobacteraceae bacterium R_SAG4]